MEREEQTHTQSQHNLTEDFELAGHAGFVLLEDLDIIVDESNQPQPHGGDQHGDDVDVVQLCQQQGGDDNGRKDDETAHGGGALLLFLPFEAEIADGLAYRLATDEPYERLAAEQHDKQRKDGGHGCPKGDVLEHSCTGEVESPV